MRIWDRGTYECHKWEDGKVVLSFEGDRLGGRYALFRADSEKDWMIHRMAPPAEWRDPFPERVAPMLARPARLHLLDAEGEDVSREHREVRRRDRPELWLL